jgi:hypothetical protein
MEVNSLPSAHVISAALHAARLLDAGGAPRRITHQTYTHHPSGGVLTLDDLKRGEALLIKLGLAREDDEIIWPLPALRQMAMLPDSEAVVLLLVRLDEALRTDDCQSDVLAVLDRWQTFEQLFIDTEYRERVRVTLAMRPDTDVRAALGELGEEYVSELARRELISLGRHDLAEQVQRVSLISDVFGFDIVAPHCGSGVRHLEVKMTTRVVDGRARFFLTRNEAEVGLRDLSWALVVCTIGVGKEPRVLGWCRASALQPYLPVDAIGGIWREAELSIPHSLLSSGIPSAT